MELKQWSAIPPNQRPKQLSKRRLLDWLNLRPEESERTFLMFAYYTVTSIGILWLEVSVAALFLDEYGAESLPWIYIVSAGIGTMLGSFYSLLQKFLPLRRVIVIIAVLMALPLPLFRLGLGSVVMLGLTVFLMRLWLEAIYVLNELNTSITANQLFNIREIKRTFPLVSSGVLAADVVSGLSLPFLRQLMGLPNVILMACILLFCGACILYYLSQSYQQFFPDSSKRRLQESQPDFTTRRLKGPMKRYVLLLVAFFVMAQVLWLLLDFQYLAQIEQRLNVENIADFLALFSAVLGAFELTLQWFVSSRMIERLGVFIVTMTSPAMIFVVSALSLGGLVSIFVGMITLRFVDELFRYTLLASTGPVLFQPIPDANRSRIQSFVRGIVEPISSGGIGVVMLGVIWFSRWWLGTDEPEMVQQGQSLIFLGIIALCSLAWLFTVWRLRSRYLNLLVLTADRGDLSLSEVDLREFKRGIAEAMQERGDEVKKACIELLTHLDPENVTATLAPMLAQMSPDLQRMSLKAMNEHPKAEYVEPVRSLMQQALTPDVLALSLRYVWLTDTHPNVNELRPYLNLAWDAEVRGTASALMLRLGDSQQRIDASETLRHMLVHPRERERVMGCRALGEAKYLERLRLLIDDLLRDDSLRVRCAMLEAIAATQLHEYYPTLLQALSYKNTREAAMEALVRLGDEAIPSLVALGSDSYKLDLLRVCAWKTLGLIGSPPAVNALLAHMSTSWGSMRRAVMRTLLKLPEERGINAVEDYFGRDGIETLINQELFFMGQLYASQLDFTPTAVTGREGDLMRRALDDLLDDAQQRIFLLMRFLYSAGAIQAAAFNLQSASTESNARGLEILDNTLDIRSKQAVLCVLEPGKPRSKLRELSEFVDYQPLPPSERLRTLLELRHFLSDWALACCFHLATRYRWSVTPEQALASLRHPTGFVREAVLTYLTVASPRTVQDLLPLLKADPDPLVRSLQQQMVSESDGAIAPPASSSPNRTDRRPWTPQLDPT